MTRPAPTRHRLAATGMAACIVALFAACGGGNDNKGGKTQDLRSPAQYFKEQQTYTVTPHGKIRTETVVEKYGKIEYQTDDGSNWSVSYSKRADGTYSYGTPDRVK